MTAPRALPDAATLPRLVDGHWLPILDGDPRGRALFRRHYSASPLARRPGLIGNHARWAGNGEHLLLLSQGCDALWCWRYQRVRDDDQRGVECSVFRNESAVRSSDLIREAMALAWARWPGARLFTFVDPARIRSINPGACFRKAGWRRCGLSKRGLVILDCLPDAATRDAMPRRVAG